jgi:molybdopterin-binding protein
VVLGLGDQATRVLARVTRRSWTMLSLSVGESVYAQIKGVALAA